MTAYSTEPQNPLIPTNTTETGGGRVVTLLFAGLVYYDVEGNPVNEVADSIESTDGQTWDIKLKSGEKFTNGDPVTAASFVDAWNYGALSTNAQLNANFFAPIDGYDAVSACGATNEAGDCTTPAPTAQTMSGLKVVSDTEFTVQLVSPQADFPLRLGYSAYMPLPKEALADPKTYGETPVGNGPYKLTTWQHGAKIDLVPNPDYNGGRKAKNGGVSFMFYTGYEPAYADLLSDNLDVIDSIPPGAISSFQTDLGSRAINQPYAGISSFVIPYSLAHFSGDEGKLRRQAISMAINRDQITKVIYDGTRAPAKDFTSPVPRRYSKRTWSAVRCWPTTPRRPVSCGRRRMRSAPWSGTFELAYNADGAHKEWVEAVSNDLKNNLKIEAQPKPVATFGEFRTQITGKTIGAAYRNGWQADYPSIYNFLQPLYTTGAGSNNGGYSNPAFDDLVKKGASAASVEEALTTFQSAEEILLQDMPAIPLWNSNSTGGYSDEGLQRDLRLA